LRLFENRRSWSLSGRGTHWHHSTASPVRPAGLVQNRRSSVDGTDGRRASKRVSHTNGTKMAQNGTPWHLFGRSLVPSRSARDRAFLGTGELRSLERKPLLCRALCRWIPPVFSQPPAQDSGCRIEPLTVAHTRRMCDSRAFMGPSVIIHYQAGATRGARPGRAQSLSITML
jgi:hypothetical protein